MMGLLALGIPPESILATTFTRKAAGEILSRVLARMARASLGDKTEVSLARAALLLPPAEDGDEDIIALYSHALRTLVRDLHRVNVGTLDSFFIRIAGSSKCPPNG
jgi:ATP-dependent exoDNAse (exonuclease V) beta subunit